jgi:hypothetical protein
MNWLLWTVGVPETPNSEPPQSPRSEEDNHFDNDDNDYGGDDANSHTRSSGHSNEHLHHRCLPAMLPVDSPTEPSMLEDGQEGLSHGRSLSGIPSQVGSMTGSTILSDIEEDSFVSCNCSNMFRNCCVPFYRQSLCVFHVIRSTPLPCIITFAVSLTGTLMLSTQANNLEAILTDGSTGLSIKFLVSYVYGYTLLINLSNIAMMLTVTLLTGTTREALCASLHSGTFVYPGGDSIECGCWSRCIYGSGYCLIYAMMLAAYFILALAMLGSLIAGIAWFVGYTGTISCNMNNEDDGAANEGGATGGDDSGSYMVTDTVFSAILKAIRKLLSQDLGMDSFDGEAFCDSKTRSQIHTELTYFVVGQFLIVVGQINFLSIMVGRYFRVVINENRLKNGNGKDPLIGDLPPASYAPLAGGSTGGAGGADWESQRSTIGTTRRTFS